MMMATEVTVLDRPEPLDPSVAAIDAAVDLVSYGEERQVRIALSCTRDCAIAIASRMLGEELPADSDDLVRSSLGEVMNIISGRLRNTLGEQGREFLGGLPLVSQESAGAGAGTRASATGFEANAGLRFSISLLVESCSKSRLRKMNLRPGCVLAQTLDVRGLGRFAKGLRLDADTAARLKAYGPQEIEVFTGV
jgi:hypothetical protein